MEPKIAVCTLWEGDYHKGLGAFANSLIRCGFRGTIWAGYRGELPPWFLEKTSSRAIQYFVPAPGVRIAFVHLEAPCHFAQYKADFCLQVLKVLDPEASGVYYFDPDVLLLARWDFFTKWLQSGVTACEDWHYPLNPTHPLVVLWTRYLATRGFTLHKPVTLYLNSGLVGVRRDCISFLELWRDLLVAVQQDFNQRGEAHFGQRTDLFHNIDQDAFTLALHISELPFSAVGVDGMAFGRGEWLTVHAVGEKPWRRRIFRDMLQKGAGIDLALRRYWQFCDQPILVEQKPSQWAILLVRLLTRFYKRE